MSATTTVACLLGSFDEPPPAAHVPVPVPVPAESDARYGSFDFRAAHEQADADLRELLDNTESLPFRRRGYERDGVHMPVPVPVPCVLARDRLAQASDLLVSVCACVRACRFPTEHQMLKTLVERAGMAALQAASAGSAAAESLAAVPAEVGHMNLEALHERAVQRELVEALLLPSDTSCVLVHGMGGTGKTVTAVAAVQERDVRRHFSDIYWVTVGADALGEKIGLLQATLYKQLTSGKTMKDEEQDVHERQAMLVTAMTEKARALVVLDDPWMPEQVRFLNPIDGSQTDHRLLVTTRIRDLVPKATRVELPLMGEDEAVALLLDLANGNEASYRKAQPESQWPPKAGESASVV